MRCQRVLNLAVALVILFSVNTLGQGAEPVPLGVKYAVNQINVDTRTVQYNSLKQNIQLDETEKLGMPLRAGFSLPTNFTPLNSGTWHQWPNGHVSWVVRIESPGAPALSLIIENISIPDDAQLFIYPSDLSSFTTALGSEIKASGVLSIPTYRGGAIYVEYREQGVTGIKKPEPKGIFTVTEVVYIYKGLESLTGSKDLGDSESCHVNIGCTPEGANWQKNKRGVARLLYREGSVWYWCTGTLVNNTQQDGKPYFLTAEHCGGNAKASDRNVWKFYFNYERPGCTNTGTPPENLITGCTLLAKGSLSGGSDFQLLLLSSTPPPAWNAYYNGWDRSVGAPLRGVCIHHPSGDAKKISTFTTQPTTATPNVSGRPMATNSAWRVNWVPTTNGHGVTEGGSSGGPLFNSSGHIVGTLSGGAASCITPNSHDYFGKFNHHWNANGTANSSRLSPWLDPIGSDPMVLDGFDPNRSLFASFTIDRTQIYIGGTVTFTDASVGSNLTSWFWNFGEGAIPSTAEGQGPHRVVYSSQGAKTVSLTVNGETSVTHTNILTVSPSPYQAPSSLSARVTGLNNVLLTWAPPILIQDDGFETYPEFSLNLSPWIQIDGDQSATYSVEGTTFPNAGSKGSFMVFNPNATNPPLNELWKASTGNKYAACFTAVNAPNKDWLITPKMQVANGTFFSFMAKSLTSKYGLERIRVGVSTTDTDPNSFTFLSRSPFIEVPSTWTPYSFDLSRYEGELVHIAINCVSHDAFMLMIDDIMISDAWGKNILHEDFESGPDEFLYKKVRVDPDSTTPPSEGSKEITILQGYKVFRDGALIHTSDNVNQLEFLDENLPVGTFVYQLSVLYSAPQSESSLSDPLTVIINPGAAHFTITHQGAPVEGAIICIEGIPDCLISNGLGQAKANLPAGQYTATVQTVLYNTSQTLFIVDEQVTPVDIDLSLASGNWRNIMFVVRGGSEPIPNAQIQLIGLANPLVTDTLGVAQMVLPDGQFSYTAQAQGYSRVEGVVTVGESLSQTVEINLTPLEYWVTFLITSTDGSALQGARVSIEGLDNMLITNSKGIVTVGLPNGKYNFRATWATREVEREFSVEGRSQTIAIEIETVGIETVTAEERNIKLFPNPFTSELSLTNASLVNSITISNAIGSVIIRISHDGSHTRIINTESFPSGIYIVTIRAKNGERFVKKLLKN